ncbi:hypothetical protein FRC10_010793 [Ceratobasidium sp. 414]|nr:hypothetical protein FRC10_010793 [Ceratobasidium sp. 414]
MEHTNNPILEECQTHGTVGDSSLLTTLDLSCALGLGEEDADLKIVKELELAGDLLAVSVQRYLDASLMLKFISSNHSLRSKKSTPVLQAIDAMDEQLVHLQSHRDKLCQAQAEVSLVRNYSPKLAPINMLPRETLSHIIRLVTVSQLQNLIVREKPTLGNPRLVDTTEKLAAHPNTLSEVCKSWYGLITSTPALWSHIDLVVSGSRKEMFYTRASQFVKCAVGAPLFVRIHELRPAQPNENQQLARWLSPVAGQLYSLDFSRAYKTQEVAYSVLGCWFKHGTPGTVKEITVWNTTPRGSPFIRPAPGLAPALWEFDISTQRLEEFFEPITLLHLRYVFPNWDSQAYCGLAHLHLRGGSITEAQLQAIFSKSPRLEKLYLGLQVTDMEPRGAPRTPIYLPRLEALSLDVRDVSQVWPILRLITPGSRPLKLAFLLAGDKDGDFTEIPEAHAFSRRSNITTLYLGGPQDNNNFQSRRLSRTLRTFPHLRMLGLEAYHYFEELPLSEPASSGISPICPQLRELCLFDCELDLDIFKHLLRTHSVQVLRICCCRVFSGATELKMPEEELQEALSDSVPDVKCYKFNTNDCPDPYLNWDFVNWS